MKERISESLESNGSLFDVLKQTALRVAIVLCALAPAACNDKVSESAYDVATKVEKCLGRKFPAYANDVCDLTKSEALILAISEKCGVGPSDKQVREFGGERDDLVPVAEVSRRVLNEKCFEVVKPRVKDGAVVPIFIPGI